MSKLSPRELSKRFGKVAILIGISFSGATIANYINHASYWKKTIPRVQTVDFNILSHTLPTKLSYALLQGTEEELQKTLNSNYGFSGLIVTDCQTAAPDCPGQQILYASQGRFDYKTELRPEELVEHPFDLLRDPPPLLTEATYAHAHATVRDKTGKTNPGEIIGRVYYVRGTPPPFLSDYQRWLSNPLRDSGAHRLYSLTFACFLIASFALTSLFERKQLKLENQLVQSENERLLAQKESLRAENEANQARNRFVQAENEKLLAQENYLQAENEANKSRSEQLKLKNQLVQTENERLLAQENYLQAENEANKNKSQLLESENQRLRLRGYFQGFQEIIDQDFSSVIANHLEELRGILRRLNTDIENIDHDLRKAPLLGTDMATKTKAIQEIIDGDFGLDQDQGQQLLQLASEFVGETSETINLIDWVLRDLKEIANLNPVRVDVREVLTAFMDKLPPNVSSKRWLDVEFDPNGQAPLWISCNPWHLRSIVKNVIYNSTAILTQTKLKKGRKFRAHIKITCFQKDSQAGITITDNGPGFSPEALERLYQIQEKVYNTNGSTRGRGSIIVNSYLTLHRGVVELTNLPEGGASTTFLFPLVSDCPDNQADELNAPASDQPASMPLT